VNQTGSPEPVWFTPGPCACTVWSRVSGIGSIQRPWYVWMIQDPLSFGPGPAPLQIFVFSLVFCYFHSISLIIAPLSWLICFRKFHEIYIYFLDNFVMFLCYLVTKKLDEKYCDNFLLYYLSFILKSLWKLHDLISFLDGCLWFMVYDLVEFCYCLNVCLYWICACVG
jgi:hypothetical protein